MILLAFLDFKDFTTQSTDIFEYKMTNLNELLYHPSTVQLDCPFWSWPVLSSYFFLSLYPRISNRPEDDQLPWIAVPFHRLWSPILLWEDMKIIHATSFPIQDQETSSVLARISSHVLWPNVQSRYNFHHSFFLTHLWRGTLTWRRSGPWTLQVWCSFFPNLPGTFEEFPITKSWIKSWVFHLTFPSCYYFLAFIYLSQT